MTELAGIIGWVFVLALVAVIVAAVYERTRKQCAECTSRIPRDARRCKYCGAET